jgi:hypothetical protein
MAKALWYVIYTTRAFLNVQVSSWSHYATSSHLRLRAVSNNLTGDIVYVRLPGINLMIVNNLNMAHQLLSKGATINSGRTVGYMLYDL